MKKKSMKNRTLAVLMAVTMFLTYSPVLSYALTEEAEGQTDFEAETTEVLTMPEAETEEPEDQNSDSETIDSLISGLEPAESETVLSESSATGRKVLKSKAALTGSKGVNTVKAEDIRIFGPSRYETAIEVANKYKSEYEKISGSEKFENVVVAYGMNYPDALSGVYLAMKKNAPILLVQPSVEDDIANYIEENIAEGGTVYILGGTGVVRQAFENKISDKGIKAKRLGGSSRYETNLEILKEAGVDDEELLICTSTGYADSLSASAVGKPILLVGNTLTDAQKAYIQSLSTEKFYLIGGPGVVKPEIESSLIKLGYSKDNIKRLWGQTRYETSIAVADEFFKETKTVMLAYAMNFPDGLSGGPLALLSEAPIILTDSSYTEVARAYVKRSGAFRSITLGGTSLISDAAVRAIMDRKPPYITPEKKYAKVQVGETAEIRVDSNYGTSCKVLYGDILEDVGAPNTTYTDKGLSIERYTVTGKKAGTEVLVLTDTYSGLESDSVTVTVIDGEASVKTLYSIIDATGYKDDNNHKAVKHKINDKMTVYFENWDNYVRLVCFVNGSTKTFTEMHVPLETQATYPVIVRKETTSSKKRFVTNVDPGQYTSGMELDVEEEKSFVASTFGDSMANWDSVLEDNYEMMMKDLGFTSY